MRQRLALEYDSRTGVPRSHGPVCKEGLSGHGLSRFCLERVVRYLLALLFEQAPHSITRQHNDEHWTYDRQSPFGLALCSVQYGEGVDFGHLRLSERLCFAIEQVLR